MTATKGLRAFKLRSRMILPCDLDSQEIAKKCHDSKHEVGSIYTYIANDITIRSRVARNN